jgi:hypothetical protein
MNNNIHPNVLNKIKNLQNIDSLIREWLLKISEIDKSYIKKFPEKELILKDKNEFQIGNKNVYTKSTTSDTIYVGPNGGTAEVVTDNNGKKTVVITYPDGTKVVYYNENINYDYGTNNYDNYNHYSGEFENITFYGPDGGTAQVVRTPDENTIVITYKNGVTDIYYIDENVSDVNTYTGPNGNTAKVITDSNGKKAIEITFSDGSKIYYYSGNAYTYNSNTGNINHYDKYQPYDKAGAYAIQEWIGLNKISKIDGSYSNVVGLPTHRLYLELKKLEKDV